MRWPWFRRNHRDVATTPNTPYFFVGGRRVRMDSAYLLPSDGQEVNRLDFQHVLLRNLLKSNYLAPIRQPLSILDVACGTGRWGAEMAHEFPQANIVSIDLNALSLTSAGVTLGQTSVAENFTFEQCDITKLPLPFADNSFDYVHMRLVFFALPADKWVPLIHDLYRITRPGGWIESVEGSIPPPVPGSDPYMQWLVTMSQSRGIDLSVGSKVGTFLKQVGMRNSQTIPVKIPFGDWGGRLGTAMLLDLIAVSRATEVPVVRLAKLASKEEFDQAINSMEQGYKTTYGATGCFYFTFGQK